MQRELKEQGKCWKNARILGLLGRRTRRRGSIFKIFNVFLKKLNLPEVCFGL